MSRRIARIGIAAGLVLITLAASARAADGPRPGLWKVTTKVSRDGVVSANDAQTNCVTAEQVRDPSKSLMPPDSPGERCVRTSYEWTGSKLTWQMRCDGQMAMTGGGNIVFDSPEHYRGNITTNGSINGHPFTSTIMLDGTRVGECPSASP